MDRMLAGPGVIPGRPGMCSSTKHNAKVSVIRNIKQLPQHRGRTKDLSFSFKKGVKRENC